MFKEILTQNQQQRNRYHKHMKRRQARAKAVPILTKFHAVKSRKQVPQRRPFKAASLGGGESNLTKQKIIILGEKHLENHIVNLKKCLEKRDFKCTIQYTKLIKPTNATIFLISPKLLTYTPKSFYYYQTEQLNQITIENTNQYKIIITLAKKSIKTFDYSKTNIKYYPKNIHVEYFPFNLSIKTQPLEKIHDIVFVGAPCCRRKNIIYKLAKKFKIYITNRAYGKELTKRINQSKILLNLHFYDKGILETARLQEAVHLQTHIISEYPCEEDMEAIEPYKDRVEFVEVIKDDLSNIHLLEEKIEELLKGEKEVPVWENKIVNNMDLLCYPHLFHKYILGLSAADDPIKYEIVQQKDVSGNYFAHLHCYDISKFDEIYGEYIKTIETYFNIVITYSIGENKIDKYTVLKIPNRGLDIGAKFCMVQYLKDQNEDYSHILFLHSKTDVETRKKYFGPLISAIKENEFIENINDYDGYFPDIQWEIQDDRLKMISGNPQFVNSNLPERNMLYRNELLDYLGCENRTNRFVEGNVYLLSKKIVERLFGDKKLYNILNRPDDFDYNWVRKRHRLQGDFGEVYNEFVTKKLSPRDDLSYDGYVEHTFERVVLNACSNNIMILNGTYIPHTLEQFCTEYNILPQNAKKILNTNKKTEHRYKCFTTIPVIRNIIIKEFGQCKEKESILIEFRPFPHLEFLLRNTIIKLPKWSHTVVCGNLNVNMIQRICDRICKHTDNNIRVIHLDIDNLTPSSYSQLLTTKEFWEKFEGEKLLIYQEDSMLFHGNIKPFLKYDYVGAPWPLQQDDNSYGVGNGGFSLRSKSKLLECIEKIKPEDLPLGKSTQDYMKNTGSTFVPEDVYFSKTMIDYNIGIVAPRSWAREFSQETQLSKNPLGGHNYWLSRDIFKVAGNCENIGVYSPYPYMIGGGEYYISMLIKFFIKCGCKSVHFYNKTDKKIFDKTLTNFFTSAESFIIKQMNSQSSDALNTYDFFIEMGNYQYPRITTNIARKFIYHCQFPFDHYNKKITIKPMHNVDYIILNSEYTKKYYMRKLRKNDHCKLQINYPICFKKQSYNQPLKEKNTFVMIGRIHMPNADAHNKCHLDIIKIFRQFLSEGIPFKLYIIGTVQSQYYYKYLKRFFEVEKRIEIIGNCPEEKKNKIIDKCQYHIHATGINRDEEKCCFCFEHFGISTIECINRSCIPICVNGGFFPYYIEDRKNGFLYNTTAELTKLLKQILTSKTPPLDIKKCHEINAKIIEKFSESYFYDRLAKMLLQ